MRTCLTLCLAIGAGLVLPAAALDRAPLPSEGAMEPCPAQGSGFVKIPGTSTCVRLSGRVAAEAGLNASSHTSQPVVGRFQLDTRTPSAQGDVRSFVRFGSGR